jgi:hypothetical protein
MIQEHRQTCAARTGERGEFAGALDRLDVQSQRVLKSLAHHLAEIERAHGEAVALAVAQKMELVLRGRETA